MRVLSWHTALVAAMTGGLVAACSDDAPVSAAAGAGGNGNTASSSSVMVTSASAGGAAELPSTFTVEGTVVDEDGDPIEGAMVLQGGRPESLILSEADGTFVIEVVYPGYGIPGVTAITEQHRATGVEFHDVPGEPVELLLHTAHPPDNTDYIFQKPGDAESPTTEFCGHCHNTFAGEFQSSKHAEAARDPLVQDLFAGVSQAHADEGSCVAAGGIWKQGRRMVGGGIAERADDDRILGQAAVLGRVAAGRPDRIRGADRLRCVRRLPCARHRWSRRRAQPSRRRRSRFR